MPSMRGKLLALLALALALSSRGSCQSAVGSAGIAIMPVTSQYYGSGYAMLGLANTTLNTNIVDYRFRATHSGTVSAVHFYVIINHVGYSGGTNGSINVQIETDDGSASHLPSGTVLGSFLITNPANTQNFPIVIPLPAPILSSSVLYHVLFTNADAAPTVNYCSIDALINSVATPVAPAQLTIPDSDWTENYLCSSCGWQNRTGYSPILEIDYTDGFAQGNGYMESWIDTSSVTVSGTTQVREQFTPKINQSVSSIYFRTAPSGTGTMNYSLATIGGTVLASGPMSAAPNESGIGWLSATFSTQVLQTGQNYTVTFSTSGSYSVWPIRRGVSQSFSAQTYFNDGYAQQNISGAGWIGFPDESGNPNQTDDDLQFFFLR